LKVYNVGAAMAGTWARFPSCLFNQWCDFKPGHNSDFPSPLRIQSRARSIRWRRAFD